MGCALRKKVNMKATYSAYTSITHIVVIMQQIQHSFLSFPWLIKIKKSQTPTEYGSFPMT